MLHTYSVIIQPSPEVIQEVKKMKDVLFTEIGWYNSRNSLAHITLNEFECSNDQIEKIKEQLSKIVLPFQTQEVVFDHFDHFANGAFFLAPNADSKQYFKTIMQEFHKKFNFKTTLKSTEPHLSIGRRITTENIQKTYNCFSNKPQIRFNCDRLALRIFNTQRKQFDTIDEFLFGNTIQENPQLCLF
ncbi:2'-5' RNA ligase family protein [Flavobacterium sp.]|uniref:2'-5' RNA ligase family protein n=1 Tax=Flavobacterium sp. TaxID=239 RepID=UPI003D11EBC8